MWLILMIADLFKNGETLKNEMSLTVMSIDQGGSDNYSGH